MFMCLTNTGDLLADAFISVYSKMVNLICRQFQRGRMKVYLPPSSRQSFENPDVSLVLLFVSPIKSLLF